MTETLTNSFITIINTVSQYEKTTQNIEIDVVDHRRFLVVTLYLKALEIYETSKNFKISDIDHFLVLLSIIRTSVFCYEDLSKQNGKSLEKYSIEEQKIFAMENAVKYIQKFSGGMQIIQHELLSAFSTILSERKASKREFFDI